MGGGEGVPPPKEINQAVLIEWSRLHYETLDLDTLFQKKGSLESFLEKNPQDQPREMINSLLENIVYHIAHKYNALKKPDYQKMSLEELRKHLGYINQFQPGEKNDGAACLFGA